MATKIRLELQVLDGQTIRCAVVELTNGAGGVYAKTVKACSRAVTTPGVSFGGPFLKPDGTYTGNDIVENTPGTIISGNCGAASLTATYASARSNKRTDKSTQERGAPTTQQANSGAALDAWNSGTV